MIRLSAAALVCFVATAQQTHENLNAVVWMQTAAEYRAAALQTYRSAEVSLRRALADRDWTAALEQSAPYRDLPPAIILDLDETVLDNSVYQARMTATGAKYSEESWAKWVAEKKAGLVPGAADFLNFAHAHGVTAFYVTNRSCDASREDDPTAQLVASHNLPLEPGRLLCRSTSSDKSPRRAQVARSFRILLLIGDDFGDFVTVPRERATVEGRAAAVMAYRSYWGERWFILPNPSYGSWERTVGYEVKEKHGVLKR